MVPQRLIAALLAANFHKRYYSICAAHPLRSDPKCTTPVKELAQKLSGIGTVKKLSGPGRIFSVSSSSQPDAFDFTFIIQGAGITLEPCLSITDNGERMGTNFSVLAYSANEASGNVPAKPPYPRPAFYSLDELRDTVAALFQLALDVGGSFHAPAKH